MYTHCTIRFIDDGTQTEVIVKAYDSFDENDDAIFFYGLSASELQQSCKNGDVIEDEWIVISVNEVSDKI